MDVVTLAQTLIQKRSLTPFDAGCQALISDYLTKLGFNVTSMPANNVSNLWAERGTEGPLLVFAGHTDVVPTGDENAWTHPPFSATINNNRLYGRGAVDMKGAIAAMLVAIKRFLDAHPDHKGRFGFLITSDEEGDAIDGTRHVIKKLTQQGTHIDHCLVGEASSEHKIGDQCRIGRRGSLHARCHILGKQGHIAYPEKTENPIHNALAALKTLTDNTWDQAHGPFPPTSFQISNIHAGTRALNVVPGECVVDMNFRFHPNTTPETLKKEVKKIFNFHKVKVDISWKTSSLPFLSTPDKLTKALNTAIQKIQGFETILSAAGGTSDGRFIAPTGTEVIECGLLNDSAHAIDESITIKDLEDLSEIYYEMLLGFY